MLARRVIYAHSLDMLDDDDFFQVLTQARNRVLYDNYKNSLVEWTLSKAWMNPVRPQRYPGGGTYNGTRVHHNGTTFANIFVGEINL
jgi:hypothetical protein